MMKATLGALAAALLAGAFYVQPAHAQLAPQGSYLNTCTNVGMHGDRLIADCRRSDGAWRSTLLDTDGCVGDIANLNGRLSCNRVPNEGYGSSERRAWREGYGSSRPYEWRDEYRTRCSAIYDPYERERCWRGW
jgi:hypothetical protein